MASITANGSKGHHKFTLEVVESEYDVGNNTSTVAFTFKLAPIVSGYDWAKWGSSISYTVTIEGTNYTGTIPDYNGSSTVTLKSGTQTIVHNNDGTKSISFSFSVSDSTGKSYTCGTASASGSLTLTTIPRASSIASVSGGTIGSTLTVNINRNSSSFTHVVQVSYNNYTQIISSNAGTSASATLNMNFCNYITGSTTAAAILTLVTYNGGTAIGTVTQTLTLTVPSSVVPSVSAPTISGQISVNGHSVYVQTKSTVTISTSASGSYGSSISSCSVEVRQNSASGTLLTTLGSSYNSSSQRWIATLSNINYTGTIYFVAKVTDSRGRTNSANNSISVYAYANPTVSYLSAQRNSTTPTTVTIKFSGAIAAINNWNTKSFKIYYKLKTASESQYALLTTYDGAYSYTNQTYTVSNTTTFESSKSYDIKVVPADYSGNGTAITTDLGTSFELIHVKADGTGIGFGKFAETSNAFECALTTTFSGNVNCTGNLTKDGSAVALASAIPTVNNATLTIQKNGTKVKDFSANASSNVTCNIEVPTNTDIDNRADTRIAAKIKYGTSLPSSADNGTIFILYS